MVDIVGKSDALWEVYKLNEIASFRRGSFPQPYGLPEWYDDENGFPFVQVYDVGDDLRLKDTTKRKISKAAADKSVFIETGTLIITIQGSIAITHYDAYIDRTLLLFTAFYQPTNKVYFQYQLLVLFDLERQRANGSTIKTITKEQLSSFKIPLPPLPEQKKIADILSTVDEAIQNTKAQIEKTKELKRGLMQKLFSEGIGHTEFKDSKLGRIPKEWEVRKYEKVVERLFVGIATSTTEYYDSKETGTLLLRNTNIKNGYLDLSSVEHITRAFDDDNTKKRLRTGDVLSVRTGYPGISAVVPLELDGSQSFTTLVSRFDQSNVNPYFVCYLLNSEIGRSQIKNLQFGGQQQNLNVGSLRLLDLIVPPKVEQDKIVEILRVVDSKKDNLDEELRLQIDKKKGLMQKLLTGEVRVKI